MGEECTLCTRLLTQRILKPYISLDIPHKYKGAVMSHVLLNATAFRSYYVQWTIP